jgi:hypothetical protein
VENRRIFYLHSGLKQFIAPVKTGSGKYAPITGIFYEQAMEKIVPAML